jgi:hypothetical protein
MRAQATELERYAERLEELARATEEGRERIYGSAAYLREHRDTVLGFARELRARLGDG